MALTRKRLAHVLALAALALVLPACSAPVRTTPEGTLSCVSRPVTLGAPVPEPEPPRQGDAGAEIPVRPARAEVPAPGARAEAAGVPACAAAQTPWITPEDGPRFADSSSIFWDRLGRDVDLVLQDYRNYYSLPNLALFALGIGAAAPVANTPADRGIRHWIQTRAHGHVESLAELFNYGGQVWVALPAGLEIAALCGLAPDDYTTDGGLFEWSNRSLRAIAVGFPPVVACYALLGSARPNSGDDSRWHPFEHYHGMSGHTFIGAIPFLTAASMTDNPWLRYPLIAGSFLTGWARLYEDRHYFSQVALGWWCAALAVHSVNQTEDQRRGLAVVPMAMPGGAGMGLEWRY
jgi:hypothetical protein